MSIIVMLNSVAYQLDHSLAQPSRIQTGTSQTQLCTVESGLYQLDHKLAPLSRIQMGTTQTQLSFILVFEPQTRSTFSYSWYLSMATNVLFLQ